MLRACGSRILQSAELGQLNFTARGRSPLCDSVLELDSKEVALDTEIAAAGEITNRAGYYPRKFGLAKKGKGLRVEQHNRLTPTKAKLLKFRCL